jgi:hypothetical protein
MFTEAKAKENRRPYPFVTPRLEVISFGLGVICNPLFPFADNGV